MHWATCVYPALNDGEWLPLAVPDRVVWNARSGPLRFHDLEGQPVMLLDERKAQWVAGPFVGRHVYVSCSVEVPTRCNVQNEAGATLFADDIDALRPFSDGCWWLRQGELWRRVDAQGRATDAARYRQQGLYPRYRQYGGSAGRRDWPGQVSRYATGSEHDTPEPGWLMADGRFAPLPTPRGSVRMDYCGGRWWGGRMTMPRRPPRCRPLWLRCWTRPMPSNGRHPRGAFGLLPTVALLPYSTARAR